MVQDAPHSVKSSDALLRGARLRCPQCGEGKLLAGYLRQEASCGHCGLKTGDIRADDGPPWLTLILVGHLLAPFMIIVFMTETIPMWLVTALMALTAIALCLAVLPRAKGLFIAAIWRFGANSEDLSETA